MTPHDPAAGNLRTAGGTPDLASAAVDGCVGFVVAFGTVSLLADGPRPDRRVIGPLTVAAVLMISGGHYGPALGVPAIFGVAVTVGRHIDDAAASRKSMRKTPI